MNKTTRWTLNALKKIAEKKKLAVSFGKYEKVPFKDTTQKAKNCKFKQGWREIGGKRIFFRSKWEANFGYYLQWQKEQKIIQEWFHEPQTFWFEGIKRGCVSYLPDFKVIFLDDTHEWIEVKGYMDQKSRTKINRFKKYFPEEKLIVVGEQWYKKNLNKMRAIIPGWEK